MTRATNDKGSLPPDSEGVRLSKRHAFGANVLTQIMEVLKPGGSVFGLLAAGLVLASASWAFAFHLRMQLPNHLWQWDHNILFKGAETLFPMALWTFAAAAVYDSLASKRWMLIKHIADHILTAYIVGLLLLPIPFVLWEDGGMWTLLFILLAPILATAFDWIKAVMFRRGDARSTRYRFTRIRRLRSTTRKKRFDGDLQRPLSKQLYTLGPLYFLAVSIVINATIWGFSYTSLARQWIVFPNEKGKIAILRTGDFWIVKEARRVNDVLFVDESSFLVKLDDPKYSMMRMTKSAYKLTVLDGNLKSRLGFFGTLSLGLLGTDIE